MKWLCVERVIHSISASKLGGFGPTPEYHAFCKHSFFFRGNIRHFAERRFVFTPHFHYAVILLLSSWIHRLSSTIFDRGDAKLKSLP